MAAPAKRKTSITLFEEFLTDFQEACLARVPRVARVRGCSDDVITNFAEQLAAASRAAATEVLAQHGFWTGV